MHPIGEIIELDIGGQAYHKVRRDVLCRPAGSALEAMFSGRHQLMHTDEGRVFIDRDPNGFELLLEWLRNSGKVHGFADDRDSAVELLRAELEYWSIDENLFGEKPKDRFGTISEVFKRPVSMFLDRKGDESDNFFHQKLKELANN